MKMNLITLQTFDNSIDAHLIKSKLESENVKCFLFDEHTVTMNPLYNLTLGGIKLKIYEQDLQKANGILLLLDKKPFVDKDNNPIHCPSCESSELYSNFKSMKGLKGVLSIFISFLFLIFPIYYKTVYRCKECDTEFKK